MPTLHDVTMTEYETKTAEAAGRFCRARGLNQSPADFFPAGSLHAEAVRAVPKAAIGAVSGSGLNVPAVLARPLVTLANDQAVVPRLGLQAVPFGVPVAAETVAPTAVFVSSGAAKPVSAAAFDNTTVAPDAIASLTVVSRELLRFGDGVDAYLTQRLAQAIADGIDAIFTSATDPRSVLAGITPIATTGDPLADIKALVAAFTGSTSRAVLITSSRNAIAMATLQTGFSTITQRGGTVSGIRLVASDVVGDKLILLDPGRVLLADSGEVAIAQSEFAAIEMSDAPTGSSLTPTSVQLVSMFQTDSIAIRAERFINWEVLPDSVVWIDETAYLEPAP